MNRADVYAVFWDTPIRYKADGTQGGLWITEDGRILRVMVINPAGEWLRVEAQGEGVLTIPTDEFIPAWILTGHRFGALKAKLTASIHYGFRQRKALVTDIKGLDIMVRRGLATLTDVNIGGGNEPHYRLTALGDALREYING